MIHTVCSHDCPDSCAVLVTVDAAGKAVKLQGDPSHPVTQGFLCGMAFQWLTINKNRLSDAIAAHAITNFLLGLWVLGRGDWHFW